MDEITWRLLNFVFMFLLPNYVICSNFDCFFEILEGVDRNCEYRLCVLGLEKMNVKILWLNYVWYVTSFISRCTERSGM